MVQLGMVRQHVAIVCYSIGAITTVTSIGELVGMLAYGITNIVLSITRWSKLIQRPYESGDPRGLRLIKAILRSLMLRRTKETKDKKGR